MSLLFLGLRSRPLMSIPKSGISQSSLNKLGLLSLSCIIIWIMAFSAIGCNWRFPGNLNLRYLRYLALTSKFDVKNHHVPHQTSHILGYPWLSHWISLHKEMTFGFRNSTFFQVQAASHRNHCGCSPAIWFRSFHLPDSLDPLGHSPEYHKGRSRKSSDPDLWQIWQSQQSQNAQNWVFLKSQIPGFLWISDTQRIFKEPKLATSLIKARLYILNIRSKRSQESLDQSPPPLSADYRGRSQTSALPQAQLATWQAVGSSNTWSPEPPGTTWNHLPSGSIARKAQICWKEPVVHQSLGPSQLGCQSPTGWSDGHDHGRKFSSLGMKSWLRPTMA